ncbi:MAG TPA: hypothetical protein VK541_01165 [Pedobacter sp.]|uniref:hypothetical protein n=1 Tax=Pedobacter sp. TaxID=1411316 RepID=UPI002BA5F32E|nr:hypothetical protein [Pedobacter sp.]HMI01056.1 hypothetical protein [Pedobacter sp.]
MKLKILFIMASVYLAVAGLGFILIPEVFGVGAVPSNPSPELITYLRVFGSPLLGIAILDWTVRNEGPSKARNAIVLGNIVGFGVIAALDVWGLLHEARPATKIFVITHLFFALAFIVAGRKNWWTSPLS